MSQRWYEELYRHFPDYDEEPYTKNTAAEVAFIDAVIGADRNKRILDVGCGTGRHALALSRLGYDVVGVDLSDSLLTMARQTALQEGLRTVFIRCDARELHFEHEFDVVMSLCEGAFSLMESDDMDRRILENMSRALRARTQDKDEISGTLILTAPNAEFMLAQDAGDGTFDRDTLRERFTLEIMAEDGEQKTLSCTQRYYSADELGVLLGELGFKRVDYFSVTRTGYDLTREPSDQEFELGVVAYR